MNIEEFHKNGQRNLLIAPAGHGKTYTISKLAKINDNNLPYLILTHTHAGVASLKEKIVDKKIKTNNYTLTTIHGFCLSLVKAYVKDYESIPSQEKETDQFYKYLCNKATELIRKKIIRDILKTSYSGVIIDEYQDCNIDQHLFALELSQLFPLRALGDPLQGIFDFKRDNINLEKESKNFNVFEFLNKPWRWINSGNTILGEKILRCREHLKRRKENTFYLINDSKAKYNVIKDFDVNSSTYLQEVGQFIRRIKSDSILIIFPGYIKCLSKGNIDKRFSNIQLRAEMRKRLGLHYDFNLLEAIDDKDFYKISKELDNLFNIRSDIFENYVIQVCNILASMTLGVSIVKEYINVEKGKFKKKKDEKEQEISNYLKTLFKNSFENQRKQDLVKILKYFHHKLKVSVKRPELFYDLLFAIESSSNSKTVLESMIERRNMLRRQGRKVKGKVIGTTLLTKGLEFDTVVIFQADMIEDRRNFYVAISRASKELYLITNTEKILLKP